MKKLLILFLLFAINISAMEEKEERYVLDSFRKDELNQLYENHSAYDAGHMAIERVNLNAFAYAVKRASEEDKSYLLGNAIEKISPCCHLPKEQYKLTERINAFAIDTLTKPQQMIAFVQAALDAGAIPTEACFWAVINKKGELFMKDGKPVFEGDVWVRENAGDGIPLFAYLLGRGGLKNITSLFIDNVRGYASLSEVNRKHYGPYVELLDNLKREENLKLEKEWRRLIVSMLSKKIDD